jgi:5-methylcytosine-specific restriction endonuclease McrA
MKKSYSELLRDPRWQKKRLEVFERDQWRCVKCSDASSNLQVDHLYYESNHLPWEYPMSAFQTLCESCHKAKSFKGEGPRNSITGMRSFRRGAGKVSPPQTMEEWEKRIRRCY